MGFMHDLTGQRFGKLVVLHQMPTNKHRKISWNCLCDCGNYTIALSNSLKMNRTKSCGCLRHETYPTLTHGQSRNGKWTPEYQCWKSIIARCYRQTNIAYQNYGGRGIKVCESWLEKFENFFEDMGERPSAKHSIDRIDVNGDYSPNNCKWSTHTEQARNQRLQSRNKSGVRGVQWNKKHKKWYVTISIDGKKTYVGCYIDFEKAVEARKQAEIKYWNKIPS